MTRRAPRTGLALTAVCALAAVAYAPSFAVPFQFDDYARLGQNRALQHGQFSEALNWLGTARPLPALTLMLNYRLTGFDPFWFHALNFAVHLLATAGVFALAVTLCRAPRLRAQWPPDRALLLATAAAALFACHPLQTQAVTYIIQRYASIVALFYLWAVVCYLRARNRQAGGEPGGPLPYFVATAVLALCAVLSKENAASLPGALLLAEWIGFGWPRRWRAIAIAAALVLAMVAVPVVWKAMFWKRAERGAPSLVAQLWRAEGAAPVPAVDGETPPFTYLRTQALVLPRYLRLVVLPWGQNIDHDVPLADSLSAPVLAGCAFLAGLAGLGCAQVRRRPLIAFAILWFFVTLSVESSIIGLSDVIAEHRMYLPMAGVALGVGALYVAAAERVPRAALAAGALIVTGLVALTFARNVVWLSPITLWLDAAEKSPHKARPHVNAGVAYHATDRLDEAVVQYCRGLALDPHDEVALDNLAVALESLGAVEIDDAAAYCPEPTE